MALKFVNDFIKKSKVSVTELANLLGHTPQATCNLLKKDDMKLSQIIEIFDALDASIEFSIVDPKKNVKEEEDDCIEFDIDYDFNKRKKRMDFFSDAILEQGMTRPECAQLLGYTVGGLNRCFQTSVDDIMFSYIIKFIKARDLKLRISVKEKSPKKA